MEQTEFKEYIHDNLALVLPKLKENDDLVKNKKMLSNGLVFYYLYFSELNDQKKVAESIKTLIKDEETLTLDQVKKRLDQLDARPVETAEKTVEEILSGNCAVFVNGLDKAYILSTEKKKTRSLQEPTTEKVVRGPKVAFVEDIDTNMALIRQRTPIQNSLQKKS